MDKLCCCFNFRKKKTLPPIHAAVSKNNIENVKNILENNKEAIGELDFDEKTPLHHAAQGGHIDIIKLLLENQVEIDTLDNLNMTPLVLG